MYISDDIWVRRIDDGLVNHEHQNPEYRGIVTTNFIYVRVRNRGCPGAGPQSGVLKLYWAKASTAVLARPVGW